MPDQPTQPGKHGKQPFDKKHPYRTDYTDDNSSAILHEKETPDAPERPSAGEEQRERDQQAEQKLKQQQREQNERDPFLKGNAQAHQQGDRQR